MGNIKLPEVGKTYRSRIDPSFSIYVEEVHYIEADEDVDEGFSVEGCDPKDVGDLSAIGIELVSDEWQELDLVLVP